MTFGITDGAHNRLVYGIDGNNNTINSKQTGNPGSGILGSGHEQDVNIFGSYNSVSVVQSGLEKQTAYIMMTGSGNNVSLIQSGPGGP